MLSSLRKEIDEIFRPRRTVGLYWSGGIKSTLLLKILLETKKSFGIIQFRDGWDREERRASDAIILKYKLQVFTYPSHLPSPIRFDVYLAGAKRQHCRAMLENWTRDEVLQALDGFGEVDAGN